MRKFAARARAAMGILAVLALAGPVHAQGVQPVAHLDLTQIIGKWYEIARLPVKGEKKCVGDAIVLYAEGNKPWQFGMVTSCKVQDGTTDVHNRNGREFHKAADGRLQLSTMLIFHQNDWVLGIAPDEQWALVGSPNRKKLWVLGHAAHMDPEMLAQVKGVAAAQGFDVSKLVMGPQD